MGLKSIAGTAALLLAFGGGVTQAQNANVNLVVNDVDLVKPRLAGGVLRAVGGTVSGTLNGLPFTTDIKHFALDLRPAQTGAGCAILDLELAPIHLQLLGLHVDTSRICLNITAFRTGLLGNLLCDLSGLDLGGILNGLLGGDLLAGILENSLGEALAQAQPGQGGGNGNGNNGKVCTGQCEILNLVLGPVTLDLLGLVVNLDNCRGGPVQVCVSATASEGLLGSLLCSLTGNGLLNLNLGTILRLVDQALALGNGPLSIPQINLLRVLLGLPPLSL